MSVESEIEALRDDVRGMRAAFDSFAGTFKSSVMDRMARLEQWQVSEVLAQQERARTHEKVENKVEELQAVAAENRDLKIEGKATAAEVKKLTDANSKLEGSLGAVKFFGGLAGAALAIAETAHFIWSMSRGVH